jgi:hypothetical protein
MQFNSITDSGADLPKLEELAKAAREAEVANAEDSTKLHFTTNFTIKR